MKRKNDKIEDFDAAFTKFLKEKDPAVHNDAILTLLSDINLDEIYLSLLEDNGVQRFFLIWEHAGKEEPNPTERAGLKLLGEKSKKLYKNKKYQKLCDLFLGLLFRHLANYLKLEEREDFEKITDHDLYEMGLIPNEIYLQYFLIETLVKSREFDWNREERINEQNLACMIACFGDIYDFFQEQDLTKY